MSKKHLRSLLCLFILLCLPSSIVHAELSKKIIINEILASNSSIGLKDKDGESSDWIELYNPGNGTINLSGWSITDSETKHQKWTFPSVSIASGEYLVIFASGKDYTNPSSELHTNFSLSASGEYLGLLEPDGTISDEYAPAFPAQITDVSYGYYDDELTFFETPSPGRENTMEGQAQTPIFSVTRGFFDEAFTVTLSVSDPETKIYYTTDGTRPSAKSTLYSNPVSITTTTPLSAISISGENVSRIVTHTYFFIKDIAKQTQTPAGYPDRWGVLGSGSGTTGYSKYPAGSRAPAHYAMNTEVTEDAKYKDYIEEAFLSLPSLSLVTNPGYFFSDKDDEDEGGIYIHTGTTNRTGTSVAIGAGWERPISLEYYEPTTEKQFQINCGIRIHGAASRQPEKTTKHSFRVYFKKEYGSGKLNFDLFEKKTAVTKFDHLVLRAGFGCSWMHHEAAQREDALYATDAFLKYLQRDMGHLSAHNRFVHLFINGLYWGIYDVSERVSNKMMEAYFGGGEEDYDVRNHDGLVDGTETAWNQMVSLGQKGDYNGLKSAKLLNMENYIDYILINVYVGNRDWGNNNWFATRNKSGLEDGFLFYCWDGENSLRSSSDAIISTDWRFKSTPLRYILFGTSDKETNAALSQNQEFRLLFADRVQKHFFNGGSLTPERASEIFESLADMLDYPVILESARWGNNRRDYMKPNSGAVALYTRNDHWLPLKNKTISSYFPARTNVVYNQLKAVGLTGDLDAPVFSSKGGSIEESVTLSITTAKGDIYYCTDGSDPRVQGTGEISSKAVKYTSSMSISQDCTVKARAKNGTTWSPVNEVSFKVKNTSSLPNADPISQINLFNIDNALYINLPMEGDVALDIYSIDGKLIQQVNLHGQSGRNHLPVANLQPGIYIYRLLFNGTNASGKLIYQ